MSGTLDTARRILRGMGRREVQNKIAVAVFAIVMIGIIGVVRLPRDKQARSSTRSPHPGPFSHAGYLLHDEKKINNNTK